MHKITKVTSIVYSETKERDAKRCATGTQGMRFWSSLKKLHGKGRELHQCLEGIGVRNV